METTRRVLGEIVRAMVGLAFRKITLAAFRNGRDLEDDLMSHWVENRHVNQVKFL